MNTTNTFIRNNSLPKERTADIHSVAAQRVFNRDFVILMTHRVTVNFYRISLLSLFFLCPRWFYISYFHGYSGWGRYASLKKKKKQCTNWCNLSYPWPSLVHAGKHRTEAATSPNKHSLYAHNQCPTQASSGGKWYPLVFPCSWLQSHRISIQHRRPDGFPCAPLPTFMYSLKVTSAVSITYFAHRTLWQAILTIHHIPHRSAPNALQH